MPRARFRPSQLIVPAAVLGGGYFLITRALPQIEAALKGTSASGSAGNNASNAAPVVVQPGPISINIPPSAFGSGTTTTTNPTPTPTPAPTNPPASTGDPVQDCINRLTANQQTDFWNCIQWVPGVADDSYSLDQWAASLGQGSISGGNSGAARQAIYQQFGGSQAAMRAAYLAWKQANTPAPYTPPAPVDVTLNPGGNPGYAGNLDQFIHNGKFDVAAWNAAGHPDLEVRRYTAPYTYTVVARIPYSPAAALGGGGPRGGVGIAANRGGRHSGAGPVILTNGLHRGTPGLVSRIPPRGRGRPGYSGTTSLFGITGG